MAQNTADDTHLESFKSFMSTAAIFVLLLVLAGCGEDAGVDSTANDDCEGNVLPGNRIVRSREDADALAKEGRCNYTIAGDLEITRIEPRPF